MDLESQLKTLETDPNNVELICNIGKIYKQQNDFIRAKEFFLKALDVDPDYYPATCSLVYLLIDNGKYTEGLEVFNSSLDSHLSNESYKASLFNALFALFLLHKLSSDYFKQPLLIKHNHEELFFRMGCVFKSYHLYDAAIKVFESACELSTSNTRLLFDLAECYVNVDKKDKAKSILLDLLNKYPEDKDILEKLNCL